MVCLKELESLSRAQAIDLFYGNESGICTEGYVPYGWQFKGEEVSVPSERNGKRLNCFGLISRDNRCHWAATTDSIDSAFICEYLERLSFQIERQTVIVLDNASVHRSKAVLERLPYWRRRGLWLFYLPPYCPHLNLCETLWRVMKGKWPAPQDYSSSDALFYAANK